MCLLLCLVLLFLTHQGFLILEPENKEYNDPSAHAVVHTTANSHPHLWSQYYLPIVPKPRPLRGPRTLTSFYSRDRAAEQASPAHPWLHPAHYANETPHILFPYSISSPSNTVNAIYQHGHFFDTELGRIVRALNSATGYPHLIIHKASMQQQYLFLLFVTSDYLYLAFLAWNSHLGVPQDVWTMS
ncbi:hypothetical protein GYMLUDRAFT_64189 [Collybiopsis luxurians FD-317 M1]|uniref:Unplaced genomic scaffold GYMLUscaffold_93, whole genome shotgun sequence n=1 Tax=Collybiopsis luxurians FD-317 M1 TaxID=944289 RepID=A0A0D0BDI6_9AGAR|nr:hypothetical protein GYMLUDRAFT_64189 [Collybiopsis luxurians FD-317 M1]